MICFFLSVTKLTFYNILSFPSVSNVSYVFSTLDSILKFTEKSLRYRLFHLLRIDTDPDRHALDADPDPDPDPDPAN